MSNPNIKIIMSEGRCIIFPETYKNINNANTRKNRIFNFDFAKIIKSKNENNNDRITEIIIFTKKPPTETKEMACPAIVHVGWELQWSCSLWKAVWHKQYILTTTPATNNEYPPQCLQAISQK